MGAGSGLDADTLQGLEPDDFVTGTSDLNITGDWSFQAGPQFSRAVNLTLAQYNNTTNNQQMRVRYEQSDFFSFTPGEASIFDTDAALQYNHNEGEWQTGTNIRVRDSGAFLVGDDVGDPVTLAFFSSGFPGLVIGDTGYDTYLFGANNRVLINVEQFPGDDTGAFLWKFFGDDAALVGFDGNSSQDFVIENFNSNSDIDLRPGAGGAVTINGSPISAGVVQLDNGVFAQGRDTGATLQNLIGVAINDDIEVGDHSVQDLVLRTGANGSINLVPATANVSLAFFNSAQSIQSGQIGLVGSSTLQVNALNGEDLFLSCTGVGSRVVISDNQQERIVVTFGGRTQFRDDNNATVMAETKPAGSANQATGFACVDGNLNMRDVGFNQVNPQVFQSGTTNTFTKATINRYHIHDGTAALTLNLVDPAVLGVGQMIMICNDGSGGAAVTTIAENGNTLNWFTGAGVSTGDRTLAVGGMCTVVRRAINVFDIFGSGLS
jgi:hypothetical protein